jgi:uncharacterized protein YihD (DUF1040 family)
LRDPARIEVLLELLRQYWKQNPDLRIGQIITNLSSSKRMSIDPYYIEDDMIINSLKEELSLRDKDPSDS